MPTTGSVFTRTQPTIEPPRWPGAGEARSRLRLWFHYESERLPWNQLRLSVAYWRRDVYARRPRQGNPLRMLRQGRLQIGRGTVIESNTTLRDASPSGQIRIGQRVYVSRGVTIGAVELVEIGDYCLIGPGCYITDSDHRHDDATVPVPDQGLVVKGPTVIEDNVWLGANVVVTSGVRIGARSVIGANSVVTSDIPPHSVAIGTPATVTTRPAKRRRAQPAKADAPATSRTARSTA
jgi:acetyltransferase-like isoleucine patch superfamily enzyme